MFVTNDLRSIFGSGLNHFNVHVPNWIATGFEGPPRKRHLI
jgi:hypothetical protein